jgi:hypothetical protein
MAERGVRRAPQLVGTGAARGAEVRGSGGEEPAPEAEPEQLTAEQRAFERATRNALVSG